MRSIKNKSKKSNKIYHEDEDSSMCDCRQTTLYSSILASLLLIIVFLNITMMNSLDHSTNLRSSHVFQIIPEQLQALEASVHVPDGFFSHGDWKQWLADGLVHISEESQHEDKQTISSTTTNTKTTIEDKKKEDDDDVFDKKTDNSANSNSNGNSNANSNANQPINFAYTTLISGLDDTYKYRGFLYNALIMKKSLELHGSTADFIAMVGLNNPEDEVTFKEDLDLLKSYGIIVHILDRFVSSTVDNADTGADAGGKSHSNKLGFAEMALLKVTPWSFKQYSRVQFLDGDVMPTSNMDCYFRLNKNTGGVSIEFRMVFGYSGPRSIYISESEGKVLIY